MKRKTIFRILICNIDIPSKLLIFFFTVKHLNFQNKFDYEAKFVFNAVFYRVTSNITKVTCHVLVVKSNFLPRGKRLCSRGRDIQCGGPCVIHAYM